MNVLKAFTGDNSYRAQQEVKKGHVSTEQCSSMETVWVGTVQFGMLIPDLACNYATATDVIGPVGRFVVLHLRISHYDFFFDF